MAEEVKHTIDFADMSVHFGTFKLGLPLHFKTLLEVITREVLREQPEDVPGFLSTFLDELVEKREQGLDARFLAGKASNECIKD